MGKKFKNIHTFEQYQKQDDPDITGNQKHWFNDKETWDFQRNELNISDDDTNWSKDDKGKLVAFWYDDREEGWIIR